MTDTGTTAEGGDGRVSIDMYVYNDATLDSRVRREAATLAAAGYDVTLLATARDRETVTIEREEVDGFTIVRVPVPEAWRDGWRQVASPWWIRRASVGRLRRAIFGHPRAWPDIPGAAAALAVGLGLASLRRLARGAARIRRQDVETAWPPPDLTWLLQWRLSVLAWARAAVAAAPPARIHHGHDLTGLPAARRGAERDAGEAIYDSHEIFVDSGMNAVRPGWARRLLRRWERMWSAGITALIAVNPVQGKVIARRIRAPRTIALHNAPPIWRDPPDDRLRRIVGIPAGAPIVLYHGVFTAQRGLEELAEAMLEPGLGEAHLVFLGFGGSREGLEAIAADPRFGGRVHVVEAVTPDELLPMIAGADVEAIPIQRSTLNHLLASPNKLFESIAAGVPVAVSDLPVMARIVEGAGDGPLGVVFDPTDPGSIASAIRRILELPPGERARLRDRCRDAAATRWNWERESRALVALYADVLGPMPGRSLSRP